MLSTSWSPQVHLCPIFSCEVRGSAVRHLKYINAGFDLPRQVKVAGQASSQLCKQILARLTQNVAGAPRVHAPELPAWHGCLAVPCTASDGSPACTCRELCPVQPSAHVLACMWP